MTVSVPTWPVLAPATRYLCDEERTEYRVGASGVVPDLPEPPPLFPGEPPPGSYVLHIGGIDTQTASRLENLAVRCQTTLETFLHSIMCAVSTAGVEVFWPPVPKVASPPPRHPIVRFSMLELDLYPVPHMATPRQPAPPAEEVVRWNDDLSVSPLWEEALDDRV